jgi:hypothetical protein
MNIRKSSKLVLSTTLIASALIIAPAFSYRLGNILSDNDSLDCLGAQKLTLPNGR